MSRFEIQKELLAKNVRIIEVMSKSKMKVNVEVKNAKERKTESSRERN